MVFKGWVIKGLFGGLKGLMSNLLSKALERVKVDDCLIPGMNMRQTST